MSSSCLAMTHQFYTLVILLLHTNVQRSLTQGILCIQHKQTNNNLNYDESTTITIEKAAL